MRKRIIYVVQSACAVFSVGLAKVEGYVAAVCGNIAFAVDIVETVVDVSEADAHIKGAGASGLLWRSGFAEVLVAYHRCRAFVAEEQAVVAWISPAPCHAFEEKRCRQSRMQQYVAAQNSCHIALSDPGLEVCVDRAETQAAVVGAEVEEAVVGGCYVGSEACAETRFHLGLQVQTEQACGIVVNSLGMQDAEFFRRQGSVV